MALGNTNTSPILEEGTGITFTVTDQIIKIDASGGGGTTTNAVTFNNSNSGDASGTTFNGSAARTISTNTLGAWSLSATAQTLGGNLAFAGSSSNRLAFNFTTLGANSGLTINSTATDAASNTQKALEVLQSGANGTSTQTTYSGYFTNTKTGTSSTNIAGYFSASGGTNNYAIIALGRAGIGLVAPTAKLNVLGDGTTTGNLVLFEDSAGTDRFLILDNGTITHTAASNGSSFGGTWTATANNQYHIQFGGSFTSRTTASDILSGYIFNPTLTGGATNSQRLQPFVLSSTLTAGADNTDTAVGLMINNIEGGGGGTFANYYDLVVKSGFGSNPTSIRIVNNGGSGTADLTLTAVSGSDETTTTSTVTIRRNNGANGIARFINTGTGGYTYTSNGSVISTLTNSGSLSLGTSSAPTAKLDIIESTLGNAVLKYSSVATNDDPVITIYQNRVATTDATVTTLHSYTTATDNTYHIEATVVARRTGGSAGTAGDSASYLIAASFKNITGTVTQIGTTTVLHSAEDQAGWDCVYDISGTAIRVRITGATNNNITWHLEELKVANLNT